MLVPGEPGVQNGYKFGGFDKFNGLLFMLIPGGLGRGKKAMNSTDLKDLTDLTDFFFVLVPGELGGSKWL